jgi:protein-disulfide isomerase
MPRFHRLLACFAVIVLSHVAAHADNAWYPIRADDGTIIENHRVPVELESKIEALPGVIVLGNPRGEVTLNEFYDLNCPFCRAAEPEIEKLLKTVKELRLVLVPFPVLGIPSIQAGRVDIAVLQQSTPKQFEEFHRKTMTSRGVMDGKRAFAIAQGMDIDDKKVAEIANGQRVTEIMISHVRLGNALGIQATPGFVIKGVAINGYPGPKALKRIVHSVEHCDNVVCSEKPKSDFMGP